MTKSNRQPLRLLATCRGSRGVRLAACQSSVGEVHTAHVLPDEVSTATPPQQVIPDVDAPQPDPLQVRLRVGKGQNRSGPAARNTHASFVGPARPMCPSFCRGVKEDRFPNVRDRNDLWRLVVCITERKAYGHLRDQNRHKRGAGLVKGESAFFDLQASNPGGGIDGVAGPEPTPDFAAEMIEAVNRLLLNLPTISFGRSRYSNWKATRTRKSRKKSAAP